MPVTELDAITVGYSAAAVAIGVLLARRWRSFWTEPFTEQNKRLAQAIALFFFVPPVVLLHELGHVAAVRMSGGEVVELSWRVFWGYVVPDGDFSLAQWWWIGLSGNLASAGAGIALIAFGFVGRRLRRQLRYVFLLAGLIQLMLTLVAYPVLSIGGFMGDWVIVYDFPNTPVLSSATAVAHVATLVVLWRSLRTGKLAEKMFAVSHGAESQLDFRQAGVKAHPEEQAAWLALSDLYASRGELTLARTTLRRAEKLCEHTPHLFLVKGGYSLQAGKPEEALAELTRGLGLAGDDDPERDNLLMGIGVSLTTAKRYSEALDVFGRLKGPLAHSPQVRYWRAVSSHGLGRTEHAREGLRSVVEDPTASQDLAHRARGLLDSLETAD